MQHQQPLKTLMIHCLFRHRARMLPPSNLNSCWLRQTLTTATSPTVREEPGSTIILLLFTQGVQCGSYLYVFKSVWPILLVRHISSDAVVVRWLVNNATVLPLVPLWGSSLQSRLILLPEPEIHGEICPCNVFSQPQRGFCADNSPRKHLNFMHSAWFVCLGCVYLEKGEGFAYCAFWHLLKLVKSVLLLLLLLAVCVWSTWNANHHFPCFTWASCVRLWYHDIALLWKVNNSFLTLFHNDIKEESN